MGTIVVSSKLINHSNKRAVEDLQDSLVQEIYSPESETCYDSLRAQFESGGPDIFLHQLDFAAFKATSYQS